MNANLKITRLSHISAPTNDFKKVKKFYYDILGMKVAQKFIDSKNKIYGKT